jgi:hypothetical protein
MVQPVIRGCGDRFVQPASSITNDIAGKRRFEYHIAEGQPTFIDPLLIVPQRIYHAGAGVPELS